MNELTADQQLEDVLYHKYDWPDNLLRIQDPGVEPKLAPALYQLLQQFQSTLVLHDNQVRVLVGILDQPDDFFWCLQDEDGSFVYETCVADPIFLAQEMSNRAYCELVRMWHRRGLAHLVKAVPHLNLEQILTDNEYTHLRQLPDGTYAGIGRLAFTVAVYTNLHDVGWSRRFCYPTLALALEGLASLTAWDSEPVSGPDGEPLYVARRPELT